MKAKKETAKTRLENLLKEIKKSSFAKENGLKGNDLLIAYYGLQGVVLKSFVEWRKLGYLVKPEEKGYALFTDSMKTKNGKSYHGVVTLFTKEQVKKKS
tara:strand:+ start:64 stop:360 length:297 start_codon:yes stop_codon:yes gene_type:complete